MDYLEQYIIRLDGLEDGSYAFDFTVNDKFFSLFPDSQISHGKITIKTIFVKSGNLMNLVVDLNGKVELQCDRCLDLYLAPVKYKEEIKVRFGEEDLESEDIILKEGEYQIRLAPYFMQFILVSLPMRRVHPVDKFGVSKCDPEMLKKIRDLSVIDNSENIDPRWGKLKDLTN